MFELSRDYNFFSWRSIQVVEIWQCIMYNYSLNLAVVSVKINGFLSELNY